MLYITAPLLYITFVRLASHCKSAIQKYDYSKFKYAYNYTMVAISVTNLVLTTYIHIYDNKVFTPYQILCVPYTETRIARFNADLFMVSKLVEWLDTFFLLASNKPLTILHVFHHSSTFILARIHIYPTINAGFGNSCWTNSLVHTAMYLYYNGFFREYKSLITQMQIAQHSVVLYAIYYGVTTKEPCDNRPNSVYFALFCYFAYFALFVRFYIGGKEKPQK